MVADLIRRALWRPAWSADQRLKAMPAPIETATMGSRARVWKTLSTRLTRMAMAAAVTPMRRSLRVESLRYLVVARIGALAGPTLVWPCRDALYDWPPNGLELSCPAEAGNSPGILAHNGGPGAPPYGPARRVSRRSW